MKSILLLSLAAPLINAAPADPPKPKITKDTVPGLKVLPSPLHAKLFDSNGKLQSVLSNPAGVTLPKSTIPDVQTEPAKVYPDTIRKKIRYGPYRLPPTSENNWQKVAMSLAGMADNYHHNIEKPCTECLIASLSADLEYADGTSPKDSAWLHHSVLVSAGPKVRDPVCDESNTEVFFSSGNERSTLRFSDYGDIKAGYRLRKEDSLTMVGEFKNELDKEQWVWLAITYEIYDGPRPEFVNSHVIWMNAGQGLNCNPNEKNPFGATNLTAKNHPTTKVFSEHTIPWTSPLDATILNAGGHLHDGGVSIDIFQNGNRICEAKATYGSGAGGMGSNHAAGEHITSMNGCRLLSPLKKGDKIWLAANYDLNKHNGSVMEDGQLDEVMGVGTMTIITKEQI